jgi:hypothetical protein
MIRLFRRDGKSRIALTEVRAISDQADFTDTETRVVAFVIR